MDNHDEDTTTNRHLDQSKKLINDVNIKSYHQKFNLNGTFEIENETSIIHDEEGKLPNNPTIDLLRIHHSLRHDLF